MSAATGPTKGSRPWNWKWPPTKPKTASIPRPSKKRPDALVLDTLAIFRAVVCDRLAGVPAGVISARFHNSLVRLLACACDLIRERTGLALVALSGGVMQNALLFTRLHRALAERSFEVLTHTLTPPNDGSISLGQVAVAARANKKRGRKGLILV